MKRRPTLKDVAEAAGVHPSTVSRVLNAAPSSRITPATVQRVLAAAEALQYRPSSVARALKTSKTFTIGVAVPDLANPVFPPVIRGLEDILTAAGYTLILANADSDILQERAVVKAMLARQVDGVVLLTSHLQDPVVDELVAANIPAVLIGRTVEHRMVPSVTADESGGMASAVEHLADLGHERIAFVAGPQHVSTGRRRYEGFVEGHRRLGLEPISTLVEFAEGFDDASGAKACQKIVDWGEEFTSLIAGGDGIALGCLDTLLDHGFVVPDDVSLVGFGGAPIGKHLRPSLTTVEVPYREMGQAGADLLLSEIAGTTTESQIVFTPMLRPGGSSGPRLGNRLRGGTALN